MKTAVFLMFAGLLTATACNKKSQDEGQTRTTSAPEAVSAAAPVPQASVADTASDDSDIDLPEDFADDAAEEVTAENLEVQLSAVEKEVTAAN